ncbi:hypothetical protein LOTGIDRAFT_142409 [Lottia gigantea]|uniref:Fe2OG dioxygenase domain-containing protein n=1 Tax=Lottia gigantea TaxID=225164 RepID=V4AYG2_LOTGI|nr:hypothetical protein LOTGIDRAFT_142409 [Lottia gigantea]ESO98686.1 hypothetical protein LOTGIDRAFT_142409 [Lottia gigantea]
MNSNKSCGCKGIRSCLLCEDNKDKIENVSEKKEKVTLKYCDLCKKAWAWGFHPNHTGDSRDFEGIYLHEEFIDEILEAELIDEIDKTVYSDSQSGRRKQDYGPKVNFKKQKVKYEVFTGLPKYSEVLYTTLTALPILKDFIPVELCNLEYIPERGSAIDPHYDDFWLWGERLVTINLISETVLYFINDQDSNIEVQVTLPPRSLVVVFGEARHKWKHGIHRDDIQNRRIAMTFRELSQEFEKDGKSSEIGEKLKDIALTFNGTAVGTIPKSS